ncbi:MAG: hypothetical protein ACOZQL_25290 [Myxococcota bacterium]
MNARALFVTGLLSLTACAPARVYVGELKSERKNADGTKSTTVEKGREAIVSPGDLPSVWVVDLFSGVPLAAKQTNTTLEIQDEFTQESNGTVERTAIIGGGGFDSAPGQLSLWVNLRKTVGTEKPVETRIEFTGTQL